MLVEQAAKFKVSAADLLEDIKEAVADGQMKGMVLYEKTVEIMLEKLEQLKKLTCEQLIDAEVYRRLSFIFWRYCRDKCFFFIPGDLG